MPSSTGTPKPPTQTPQNPPARKVFNRSSFEGDFLVSVPGQTASDFEEYAPEMQFCEYVEGTIYMPSPVSDLHQDYTGFFYFLLLGFLSRRPGLGRVLMGPAVLRLTPERILEPDVFVRASDPGPDDPAALLVLEVLSPSNRGYDLEWKSAFYQEARVPEILYLDGRDQVLVLDQRTGESYERHRLTSGVVRSSAIPGFWFDASWLWSEALSSPMDCLDRVLAGPPA